jgi:hypothetical protein
VDRDSPFYLSAFTPLVLVLVLGPDSIQSLLPSHQAEALLESHRIEDTILLADQQRKKVQGKLSQMEMPMKYVFLFGPPVSISS